MPVTTSIAARCCLCVPWAATITRIGSSFHPGTLGSRASNGSLSNRIQATNQSATSGRKLHAIVTITENSPSPHLFRAIAGKPGKPGRPSAEPLARWIEGSAPGAIRAFPPRSGQRLSSPKEAGCRRRSAEARQGLPCACGPIASQSARLAVGNWLSGGKSPHHRPGQIWPAAIATGTY
jgi:hypothetical protein